MTDLPLWTQIWRAAISPQLSLDSLDALRVGLVNDDPQLIQGVTMEPVQMLCCAELPVSCACPLAYAGWRGLGLTTVHEVSEWFVKIGRASCRERVYVLV